MMSNRDALKQGEQTLTERIRESEERTKIKEMLNRKYNEMSILLAQQRDLALKLTESFNRLKEAMKR